MNVMPTEIPGIRPEDHFSVGLRRFFVAVTLISASVASAAELNFYDLFDFEDSVLESVSRVKKTEANATSGEGIVTVEKRLSEEHDQASSEVRRFEAKNIELAERNEELLTALETERARNQELMKVLTPAQKKAMESRPVKISAASTYYDSKEGVAFFSGHVHVDDVQYQLHADKAYVFMDKEGTNEVKRVVAVGNVAMTNDTRRAYGTKASYYREAGMVVLYAPEGGFCEVRDEKEYPPRIVTGSKIKFWVNSEQVEVQGARISAPVSGSDAKGLLDSKGVRK